MRHSLVSGRVLRPGQPIDKGNDLKVGFHVGVGAEQVLSRGGSIAAVEYDGTSIKSLALTPLQSYVNVGGELELRASGALNESVSWNVRATFFQPVYACNADELGLSGLDILSTDIGAKLSVKPSKWASLDYVLSAKKQPQLDPDWQV